jgi:DNA-binding winged helix-turn-helix (wHTH) protein/tetratricopeptide (TPR) repeat protein
MALKKQGKYRFHDFEVDLTHRSLRRGRNAVTVSPRTFDLLTFLIFHPQRVVTKDELLEALWPNSGAEESNLSQHIFLLRKALTNTESGDKLVITIPGRGYQFTASVTEVAATAHSGERLPRTVSSVDKAAVEEVTKHDDDADAKPLPRHPIFRFFADFRRPGPWHILAITAILAVLGFGVLFAWRYWHRPSPDSLGLVIADFQNNTSEPHFDLALKTALTIDLQQSPYLKVAANQQVADKLVELKLAPTISTESPITGDLARKVCTGLNDQAYITGDVHRLAMKYLISLQAFNCASGRNLAGSKGIADSPEGIVIVLDKVAADLRNQLGESADSVRRFSKPLFAARTSSLEALETYSLATHLGLQGKTQDAVTLFQHAVELDPQFAIAFADLGATYSNLGERDLAKASLTRAYELRDSVDESDRLYITATYNDIVTGDIQAGIRSYKEWSVEYPHNPAPFINLADLEIQAGKPALALDPAKRALALNPDNALAYVVQARAQLRLGQFEQAADTCQQAINRHLDGEQIHGFLLQIAFLRLDQAEIDSQMEWAKNTQAEPYMLLQQALIDFASGKAKAGTAAFTRVANAYRKIGRNERANAVLDAVPRIQAELGLTDAAYEMLTGLPAIGGADETEVAIGSNGSDGAPGSVDIPVAWAHVGETSRAQTMLKRELDSHLTYTLWQGDYGPQIKAAIALNQHRPQDAIDALKPAVPYELNGFDVPAMRGRAYLANKQPDLAEAEFHKILDHPGIEPLSHEYPLAQLGVARSLAAQGKTVEAGFAYKVVLQIWKDADPDLPRLKDAKAEYAKLNAPQAKPKLVASSHSTSKPSATRH